MKDLFTIGEVAKLFDLNIRTLRYYDEINLLRPEYIDKETKYRYYSTRQFEQLNTIKYLRALNMSLEQIKSFFENRDVDTLVSILRKQKKEISNQRFELDLIERKIEKRLNQIESALNSEYNFIEEKTIAQRSIVILKDNIRVDADLEIPLIKLGNQNKLNTAIFLGKVALVIEEENIKNKKFEEFSYIMLILEEEELIKRDSKNIQNIKKGDYLTLRFKGIHKDAGPYYKKMLSYIEEKKYNLNGNAIEITMIDKGITDDTSKYVTEIQIPYKKS